MVLGKPLSTASHEPSLRLASTPEIITSVPDREAMGSGSAPAGLVSIGRDAAILTESDPRSALSCPEEQPAVSAATASKAVRKARDEHRIEFPPGSWGVGRRFPA